MKRSFTIIELIFVIVILGIIGSVTSDITLKIYQTYTIQKAVYRIELNLKNTINEISKYLENSIKPSIYYTNNTIMWIGKDTESFQGIWNGVRIYSGYSGLADLNSSFGLDINTTDCNLDYIDPIVSEITDIHTINARSALYFLEANSAGNVQSRFWNNNPASLFSIHSFNGNTIILNRKPSEISDLYILSYSAYGIRFDGSNLKLIWNFRPWKNETITNGDEFLLAENIKSFEVWNEADKIRFKICMTDYNIKMTTGDQNWEYCDERVIVK